MCRQHLLAEADHFFSGIGRMLPAAMGALVAMVIDARVSRSVMPIP